MSDEQEKKENMEGTEKPQEQEDMINALVVLNKDFGDSSILKKVREIEQLGKDLEVGGQTSYQNKQFVLNEVEFPKGTSGKSRQAVFEAAVRVDGLKGLVFEYRKTQGEMKIKRAEMMRAEVKMDDPKSSDADRLEAEGEYEIAAAELRQKEIALEGMRYRSMHLLREVNDFHEEFEVNEEECKKLGFTVEDWNRLEVEDHYWRTVNDRKIVKHKMYQIADLSKEQGDALPLQNRLDVGRVKLLEGALTEEVNRMRIAAPAQETAPATSPQENRVVLNWDMVVDRQLVSKDTCPHKEDGKCKFREDIVGACTYRYCQSLGNKVVAAE